MNIHQIKEQVDNVSVNYDFFEFRQEQTEAVRFNFPIKKINSLRNYKTIHFYKPITRTINLYKFNNEKESLKTH